GPRGTRKTSFSWMTEGRGSRDHAVHGVLTGGCRARLSLHDRCGTGRLHEGRTSCPAHAHCVTSCVGDHSADDRRARHRLEICLSRTEPGLRPSPLPTSPPPILGSTARVSSTTRSGGENPCRQKAD